MQGTERCNVRPPTTDLEPKPKPCLFLFRLRSKQPSEASEATQPKPRRRLAPRFNDRIIINLTECRRQSANIETANLSRQPITLTINSKNRWTDKISRTDPSQAADLARPGLA